MLVNFNIPTNMLLVRNRLAGFIFSSKPMAMIKDPIRICLLLALFPVLFSTGQIVDTETALRAARNHLERQFSKNGPLQEMPSVCLTETISLDGAPAIYIFRSGTSGFVIMSADFAAWPVLGYNTEGYIADEKPAALEGWIDNWKVQVTEIRQQQRSAPETTVKAWNELIAGTITSRAMLEEVPPLLYSQWGQHAYYNAMCPADPDGPGGHALAGCVAVAISQVMFYFRHPQTGTGSHGYNSDYGYEYVDFGASTYEWDEMVNSIYGMACPEIAELIYHVGVSVEMNYGPGGSGSLTQDGVDALKNYFRYGPATTYINRFDMPDTFKDSLIFDLQQHKPCVMRGGDLSGSHSFVCDGYQDSLYFHFNWGWNGNWDGYFFIDNLNPASYDFTFNQGAMIHITPEDYPPYCQGPDTLTAKRGTFTDGSGYKPYPDNSDCSWLIEPAGAPGAEVMVWFHELDLEEGKDFVYIYDGDTEEAPLLGAVTGNNNQQDFISSGGPLYAVFQSDASGAAKGFNAEYVTINGPWCSGLTTIDDIFVPWFSDASGPYPYIGGGECQWLLQPQGEQYDSISGIYLYFHLYDVAQGDTLFFRDANHPEMPPLNTLTEGSVFDTLYLNTNKVELTFQTDETHCGDGWAAGYGSIFPVYCEDTIVYSDKIGTFSDGSGDKKYTNHSNCYWLIDYEPANAITITFTEFELEWGYDQLRIYDAKTQPPLLLRTYWGDEIPEPRVFESNRLLINFVTDESTVFAGWNLTYNALVPGISEKTSISDLKIFPNPAQDQIVISAGSVKGKTALVEIFNALMEKIFEEQYPVGSGRFEKVVSITGKPAGVYLIRLSAEGQSICKKFIKQ